MRLKKRVETLKNALQTIIIVKTMNFLLMEINYIPQKYYFCNG